MVLRKLGCNTALQLKTWVICLQKYECWHDQHPLLFKKRPPESTWISTKLLYKPTSGQMRRRPNILNWDNGLFVLIYCLCVSFHHSKSQSQRPWLEVTEELSGFFLFVALNRSAISRQIAMLVSHITWNQLQGPTMTIQTWLKWEKHWESFRKDRWTLIPDWMTLMSWIIKLIIIKKN